MIRFILALLIEFVFILNNSYSQTTQNTNQTIDEKNIIKIAFIGSLNENKIANDSLKGARLAIDEFNNLEKSKGIDSTIFQLVKFDDNADPSDAIKFAKLISQDNSFMAVIGHTSSYLSLIASEIYSKYNIVQISPSATSPFLTKSPNTTFLRTISDDKQQAIAIAEFISKNYKNKSVIILHEDIEYSKGITVSVTRNLKRMNLEYPKLKRMNSNEMKILFDAQWVKQQKPDIVLLFGTNAIIKSYIEALRNAKITVPFLLPDSGCDNNFLDGLIDANEYFCSRHGHPFEDLPSWPDFSTKFREKYNELPSIYAAFSYDATYTIINSAIQLKNFSRLDLYESVKKTKMTGVTGLISFESQGDLKNGPISFYSYENGGWLYHSSSIRIDEQLQQEENIKLKFEQLTKKPLR